MIDTELEQARAAMAEAEQMPADAFQRGERIRVALAALDHAEQRTAAKRQAAADRAAASAADTASAAHRAQQGPAARRLAQVRAEHAAIAAQLSSGRHGASLEELEALAEQEQAKAAARDHLEISCAPLLDELASQLTEVQRVVAVAVWTQSAP